MARPKKPTVRDAIDFWERAKRRSGPIGKTNMYFANKLADSLGDAKVMELTGADLADYVDRGQGAPAQRREINLVKGLVNYYRKMHGHEPLYLDRPRDNPGRTRWMTAEERDKFLAAAPPALAPVAHGLFFTGGRRSEMTKLRPSQVDYKERFVLLATRKTKGAVLKTRAIPIHDRLWPFIEGTEGQRLVFPGPTGEEWSGHALYRAWWTTLVSCGFADFRPHDARHTFASELVRQGVSLRVVADLLGHSTMAMVMRYTHVATDDTRDAVLRL